jgi:hypothetical protein
MEKHRKEYPGENEPIRAVHASIMHGFDRPFRTVCRSMNAASKDSGATAKLAKPGGECFNLNIETGVLHEVGLRNTLEPDPDNTGVGSFRSRAAFFLESQRAFSCFMN